MQVRLWGFAAAILAVYSTLSVSLRAPNCKGGSLSTACNFAAWFDSKVLRPAHMYPYPTCRSASPPCTFFDPEGLFTTLGGAMASTAAGAAMGSSFVVLRSAGSRLRLVIGAGTAAAATGLALHFVGYLLQSLSSCAALCLLLRRDL